MPFLHSNNSCQICMKVYAAIQINFHRKATTLPMTLAIIILYILCWLVNFKLIYPALSKKIS